MCSSDGFPLPFAVGKQWALGLEQPVTSTAGHLSSLLQQLVAIKWQLWHQHKEVTVPNAGNTSVASGVHSFDQSTHILCSLWCWNVQSSILPLPVLPALKIKVMIPRSWDWAKNQTIKHKKWFFLSLFFYTLGFLFPFFSPNHDIVYFFPQFKDEFFYTITELHNL